MKRKHKLLFILLFLINIINAQTENNSFRLNGEILEKIKDKYIYLEYGNKKDSSQIVNNKFEFKGNLINEPIQGIFSFKNKGTGTPGFYLENTNIEVKLSLKPTKHKNFYNLNIISVKGTKTINFQNIFENLYEKKNNENIRKEILNKLDSIITLNPNNIYLIGFVYSLTNNREFDKDILRKIYNKIKKESITEFYKEKIRRNLFKEEFLEYGWNIPKIQLPNDKGEIYDVSVLKGKWIFLDFWASWCFPCRQQAPKLKKIYDKYKNKNFEIVGISIEKDKDKWLKAIKNDSLNWINLIENEKISELNIKEVPTNFLINPEGKIILKNISLNDLYYFLMEIEE